MYGNRKHSLPSILPLYLPIQHKIVPLLPCHLKFNCYQKLHSKNSADARLDPATSRYLAHWFKTWWFWILYSGLLYCRWPPGLEVATILSRATNSKLIWSLHFHQSSRPSAWLTNRYYWGRLRDRKEIASKSAGKSTAVSFFTLI